LPLSQNHRTVRAGRDLWRSSGPAPLPKQGHLEQAAQGLAQAGFAYLRRRVDPFNIYKNAMVPLLLSTMVVSTVCQSLMGWEGAPGNKCLGDLAPYNAQRCSWLPAAWASRTDVVQSGC